jgi:hypothetical protein
VRLMASAHASAGPSSVILDCILFSLSASHWGWYAAAGRTVLKSIVTWW